MMHEQLGLDLPSRPAQGRADFLVAPCNALAVALLDAWPQWQIPKVALVGPSGAGKTHLSHVWADRANATVIDARTVTDEAIETLAQRPLALENISDIAGNLEQETRLFHLHNLVLENGHSLLLTGRGTPAQWGLNLPDLKSRAQGATLAEIAAPDDQLLGALLAKLFADRQIMPHRDVIPYLLSRMDRSFESAQTCVARLDQLSLARKRPITRPLAAELFDMNWTDT